MLIAFFVVHMWKSNSSSKNDCYSETDDIAVYGVYLGMWLESKFKEKNITNYRGAEKSFEIYENNKKKILVWRYKKNNKIKIKTERKSETI